ncbi:hypothetical protein SAMN05216338_104048 [Bradyrhizobium sp. Rc2d]|nr:hypothetical protein SAMN05216338_104048 [Bradyrhizobium sp. Rc2d]
MRERKKLAATQRGDRRSRASMRSPLCRAPLTSVASDSLNLLCWTCPAGGDWACRGLAFFVPRNRRQFAPVLCPLCRLSDLPTSRCFHSAYPSRLMQPRTQRVFDGAAERLGAKFLMRIGSTLPPLNRLVRYRCRNMGFRSLPCRWALATKGPGAFGAPFATCGAPEFESSLSQVRFAHDGQRREADLHRRAFGVGLAPQINVLAGSVAGFARCLGPIQHGSCWSRRRLDGGRARRTARKPGLASNAFCSRPQSRPRKPHLSLPPIRRAGRGQLRWSFRYR